MPRPRRCVNFNTTWLNLPLRALIAQWFLTWVRSSTRARWVSFKVSVIWFTPLVWFVTSRSASSVCAIIKYIVICFEIEEKSTFFPMAKGSMNTCTELVGISTFKKIKNHYGTCNQWEEDCINHNHNEKQDRIHLYKLNQKANPIFHNSETSNKTWKTSSQW